MKTILCLLAAALLCGCVSAHIGNNFDTRRIEEIKKGETTEPQLVAMFGQPNLRTTDSATGNSLAWSYSEGQAGLGGATSSNKTLTVWLDQSGTVTNYNYSTGSFSSNANQGTNSTVHSPRK